MSVFEGSAVALVTPFTKDGVHLQELKKLIDFQIDNGTDSIVICGTTGEPPTMTEEEKHSVIETSIAHVNKRVPVIVGAASNDTAVAVKSAQYAQSAGADGILSVTPYYNKCSQEGIYRHFIEIADHVDIPIIVYNVPARTGVTMSAQTLYRLSDHKNIAGMKEASGDISLVAEMCRLCKDRLSIVSGNDDQIIPLMSLGGKGVISVAANIIPRQMHDMTHAYLSGDVEKARDLQLYYKPLIDALFWDVNPIPVKMALNMMGFNAGPLRLPLCEMPKQKAEELKKVLTSYGLI